MEEMDSEIMDIICTWEAEQLPREVNMPLEPQLFLVFDSIQFDLTNLDMEVILNICKALPQAKQVNVLLASKEVSQHPKAKVLLFQLRRTQRIMHRVLGQ